MLTIKTFLDKDEYGGRGVFAAENVKKGEIVWRYSSDTTRIITVDEYTSLLATGGKIAETMKKYCYPCYLNGERVLMHDLDNGSYMNHSDNPNTGMIADPAHRYFADRDTLNIALRDIAKGEQITYDYFEFVENNPDDWRDIETCMQFLFDMNHPRTRRVKLAG